MKTGRRLILVGLVVGAVCKVAAAAGPVWVTDFETPADGRLVRSRKRAAISARVSSHGRRSLQVRTGDYLNLETSRLGQGRRGDLLRIDFFNSTRLPQSVRVEMFDATSRKGYWYRHVRKYVLRPGWSTLSFSVSRLYRGEKNSQRIKNAFLDPAKINRVDLAFGTSRESGFVYVDNIRFEPDPPMPEVPGLRAFDFGPENQAARFGFTACSREKYDRARGYGWSSSGWPRCVRDYVHPNNLLADFREARDETFSVDVPKGEYRVRVYYEDPGWWEDQFARFTWRRIKAEGKTVWEERLGPEAAARRFYRFADTEPTPDTDVYRTYIRDGRYKPKAFDVTVRDGRLDLRFEADRPMVCRIAAVVVWPGSADAAAGKWLAELDRRLRAEFDAENVYIDTSPSHRSLAALPEAARKTGLLVFSAGGTTPTPPGYVPAPGELVSEIKLACVPGGSTGTSVSLMPLVDGQVKLAARVPGLRTQVLAVQNRLKRHRGGYTIVPDILRPMTEAGLHPGRTRQFWLEVTVPEKLRSGSYAGEVRVEFAGRTRTVPVSVTVLPIRLAAPRMAFGLFGLLPDAPGPPDALERVVRLLRDHGMSSAAGVPLGRVTVKDGAAAVDFAQADRVMSALRKAGFTLRVDTYGGGGVRGVGGAARALERPHHEVLEAVMTQVRAHARAAGWLPFSYSMVDEPHWSDRAVAKATDQVKRTAAAAPWLLINGYWSPRAGNRSHQALMDALGRTTMSRATPAAVQYLKAKGKSAGFYGGCSRHEFGLKQWAADAAGFDAHYAWHFYVRYGDLYYDLDAREPDVCMFYCTATGVRPALRLKAVRAGAYDFRYLRTLADALAKAPKDAPAAAAARKLLETARAAGNLMRSKSAPTIQDPDAFRRRVAHAILKLKGGGER